MTTTTPNHPYRDKYNDHNKCPWNNNFQDVFALFNASGAGVRPPNEIRQSLCNTGNQGKEVGIVLLVLSDGQPRVNLYHHIIRHAPEIQPQPFDNQVLAFLGDVHDGQDPHSVVIDDTVFGRTNNLRIPTAAQIDTELAADPNATMLGPYAEGDEGSEVVRTRPAMFIPNRYASMLLERGLTPKEAWLRIRGAIVTDGLVNECANLITWLRVALTSHGAAGNHSVLIVQPPIPIALASPDANVAFRKFIHGAVIRAHPTLDNTPSNNIASTITQEVGALTNAVHQSRTESQEHRAAQATKTISDMIGEHNVALLLRLTGLANEDDLPSFWNTLAQKKSGHRRSAVSQEFNATAQTLGYHHLEFQVTQSLTNTILDISQWYNPNPKYELTVGINPFTAGHRSTAANTEIRAANLETDQLQSGSSAPALQDMRSASASTTKAAIPRSSYDGLDSAKIQHVLWTMLLGAGSDLATGKRNYVAEYQDWASTIQTLRPAINENRGIPVPTLLAYVDMLDTTNWLVARIKYNKNTDIDFIEPFRIIQHGRSSWEVTFPDSLKLKYFPERSANPVPIPAAAPAPAPTPAPAPAPAPTPVATPRRNQGSIQQNTAYNVLFQDFQRTGIKAKEVRGYCRNNNIAVLRNPRMNCDRCLSFHITGTCNTNCANAADHNSPQDPVTPEERAAEDQALAEWCATNWRSE